jgi:hypothetical protein
MTMESVMPCNRSMRRAEKRIRVFRLPHSSPFEVCVLRNLKIFAGSDIHSNIAHVEELYGIMYVTSVCISAVNEQVTAHH